MNNFGATAFSGAAPTSAVAAAADTELVRYLEFMAELENIQTDLDAVEAAEAASAHDAVTVPATNESLTLTLSGQALTGEVRLVDETEFQAAATGVTEQFLSPSSGDVLDLGKLMVSNVVLIADGDTAVENTDYLLDANTGIVTVLAGSILIGETVDATFDCAQVMIGPALEVTEDGLQCKLGTGRHQAARGDHTHTDLHKPITVVAGAGGSVTLTINPGQRLTAEVALAASSGLAIDSGLKVDTTVIATKASVDSLVSDLATLEGRVDVLEAAATTVSVEDTDSVDLTIDAEKKITATVRVGEGLAIAETGVEVDFDSVAAKEVTDDHETRLDDMEATSLAIHCSSIPVAAVEGDTLTTVKEITIPILGANDQIHLGGVFTRDADQNANTQLQAFLGGSLIAVITIDASPITVIPVQHLFSNRNDVTSQLGGADAAGTSLLTGAVNTGATSTLLLKILNGHADDDCTLQSLTITRVKPSA